MATDPNNISQGQLLSSLLSVMMGGGNANGGLPQQLPTQQQTPSLQMQAGNVNALLQQMQTPGNAALQCSASNAPQASHPASKKKQQSSKGAENTDKSVTVSRVGKDMKFNEFILNSKATREAIAQRGSRVIACRARGMPMDHSFNVSTRIVVAVH